MRVGGVSSAEEDDLPERFIVVREPFDADGPDEATAELEALAAEVAEADGARADDDEVVPTIDIDAPDDPEELQAELDALAREVGAIDLDEVDLRVEPDARWASGASGTEAEAALEAEHEAEAALEAEHEAEAEAEHDGRWVSGTEAEHEAELETELEADAELELEREVEVVVADEPDRIELDDLVDEVAASQAPDDDEEDGGPPTETFRWPDDDDDLEVASAVAAAPLPPIGAESLRWDPEPEARRDETGPGTLRPSVPEPVIAARTTSSPSRSRRTVSRLRSLLGLVFVVLLAGVGLAGAIGAAVLLVVLVLSRAFGSG